MNKIPDSLRPSFARFMCIAAICSACHCTAATSGTYRRGASGEDRASVSRTAIFSPGEEGSRFYRIPGIVALPSGRIVAVADKRIDSNADLPGRIDVVARYSDDNGITWSGQIPVMTHDEGGGYGDPCIIYDRREAALVVVATHGRGLWDDGGLPSPAAITVSRSTDGGLTWSAPTDVSPQFYGTAGSGAPVEGITAFATSGRGLQLADGRLMFALVSRHDLEKKWGPLEVHCVYSDDGGRTWSSSGNPVDTDGDETKFVQLADGRVMASVRSRKGQMGRKFCYSSDGGLTWTPAERSSTLIDPACNGEVINWTTPAGRELLLHSLPAPDGRRDVALWTSEDNGATWQPLRQTSYCHSAYSSMAILPDGTLGMVTEEACHSGGLRLFFQNYRLPD
ncbi:MAG: glycoside hydrolase [Muribaculaceae bacterium]|nr:glycoside hydrolase [Muribaculaceae bacterium]